VVGFGLIGLAGWAVWFPNVDLDVKYGPRSCGAGALRVLLQGQSQNRGVLSAPTCRSNATEGVVFCSVLALLGLVILALGLLERLGIRRLPVGPGVVPLRRWSVNWRPPYLQVEGDSFHIVIPRLFGNRRWTVPLRHVTVATVPRERQEQALLALQDVVFDEPQRVEMIAARYSYCIPNLQVFFEQPQRVPTVRRFPVNPGLDFTPKETRSPKGVVLDHADLLAKRFESYVPDPADETPVAEYLLRRAALARARTERQIVEAVDAARNDGLSWARIGALLGTSAQAAQQRYGHLTETS
jgi:hypothetical protein